jgi:GNAT superfamily N-acetyltransferase
MIGHTGRVNLLYVRPGFQHLGVGRALLGSLEAHAAASDVSEITLRSSSRARSFYERQGYASAGPPAPGLGVVQVFPYAKTLAR